MVTPLVSVAVRSVCLVLVDSIVMDLDCQTPLVYVMLDSSVDLEHRSLHQLTALLETSALEEGFVQKGLLFKPIAHWVRMEIQPETEQRRTVLTVTQGK